MRLYTTELIAINPSDNELCIFAGPNVPGISFQDAQEYCQNNALGYCSVTGILEKEIPSDDYTHKPDYSNAIDYRNLN